MNTTSAHPNTTRGMALLVAIILATVALSIGTALTSLSHQQLALSVAAEQSEYAFYAADAALECALYLDKQQDAFNYDVPGYASECPTISGPESIRFNPYRISGNRQRSDSRISVGHEWFSVEGGIACARFSVVKAASGATTIYARGRNICADGFDPSKVVEQSIKVSY